MRHTTIAARGLTFDAREAGPEDGPLVLLLHGWPQTGAAWRRQVPVLAAAGYRAVAPDQRGYSPGARPRAVQAYRMPELVADVLAIADELGAERFSVVGHDWGGAVAWQLAARHPDRVQAAVSLSTPHPRAFADALREGIEQKLKSSYALVLRSPLAEHLLTGVRALGLREVFALSGLRECGAYVDALGTPEAMRGPLHWYRAADGRSLADMPPVEVPTLFVWGSADPALGRTAAERSARYTTGPYRFEVLPGAGHWLPELEAERVNPLLLSHLASHVRRAA